MSPRKPILIGLTGSIGMGKSTVAGFFAAHGIPIWDADSAVHELYRKGAAGFAAIETLTPDATTGETVDRAVLSEAIRHNAGLLDQIEAVIHPLVAAHRRAFIKTLDAPMAVFDIPLIFETLTTDAFDVIVVVDVDPDTQRARVLARPGMTVEKFETILGNQIPNGEKVKGADYVVDTGRALNDTKTQVDKIIEEIRKQVAT